MGRRSERSELVARYLDPMDWARAAIDSASMDEAWAFVQRNLKAVGMDEIVLAIANPTAPRVPFPLEAQRRGTMVSEAWERLYQSDPNLAANDPNARLMAQSHGAILFSPGHPASMPVKDQAEQHVCNIVSGDFGLKHSTTFCHQDRKQGVVHVLYTYSRQADAGHVDRHRELSASIMSASAYFFEALAVKDIRDDPDYRGLSPREKLALTWCAMGRQSGEIAHLMSISKATVNEYIRNAMQKLKASNRTQACCRAMLLDLIAP